MSYLYGETGEVKSLTSFNDNRIFVSYHHVDDDTYQRVNTLIVLILSPE